MAQTGMNKVRLAWLSTHPIQYQAPLLRQIAACPDIELTALFFSDFSTRSFVDPEFNRTIKWDTPLLEGYRSEFLPGTGAQVSAIKAFEPRIGGLAERLTKANFDAVLVQGWQHYGMLKAAWLAKRAGLQVLMRCEASDHVASSTGLKGKVRETVVSFLLSKVDKCLAIGTRNREFYLRRGFKAENIGSMPYCVDNDHFRHKAEATDVSALRAELGLDTTRPVILYASKLMRRKFPDHLLQAYAQLPEPRPYLLFVGDGELRASLEAEVAVRKLADVHFLGFRNQGELPTFYALADIFVLPSINETWGLAVFEHVRDIPKVLAQFHRILKPGGVLYATFGPLWYGWGGDHVSGYDSVLSGFNHLTLVGEAYRRYLDGLGAQAHSEHDGRTWIDNDLFSRLKPAQYLQYLDEEGFKRLFVAEIIDPSAVACLEHPDFDRSPLHGVDEHDLLASGMTIIYRC